MPPSDPLSPPSPTPSGPDRLTATIVGLNGVSALSHLAQFGVLYPLVALWLDRQGMPAAQVGLVGSAVWLGLLAGNLCTPWAMARSSAGVVAGASALLTAAVAAGMARLPTDGLIAWLLAAAALGVAIGLRWVGVESWLYAVVPAGRRGRLVGLHETFIHLAQTVGPALIAWVGLSDRSGFGLAVAVALATLLPLALCRTPMPASTLDDARLHPLAVLRGTWRQLNRQAGLQLGVLAGLVDGVLFGMLPVALLAQGLSGTQASALLVVFGVGGLVTQVPLGWWADHRGVRSATRLAATAGVAGALLLPAAQAGLGFTAVAAALLGLVSAAGLTLCIVTTSAQASASGRDMSVAITEVSLAFTAGNALGPALAGVALQHLGPAAYAGLAALGCAALVWPVRRLSPPLPLASSAHGPRP